MKKPARISCWNKVRSPSMKILFLGYGLPPKRLFDALVEKECEVLYTEDLIDEKINVDLIVSFGYRHILRKNVIDGIGCPILNLRISYLPFNRGAHPNFWSFHDNTPAGVTIHLIDEGVDTGDIVYQKKVTFDRWEQTFADTYKRLIDEVQTLFLANLDDLLSGNWIAKRQQGQGTFHRVKDLPEDFSGWSANIDEELKRLADSAIYDFGAKTGT